MTDAGAAHCTRPAYFGDGVTGTSVTVHPTYADRCVVGIDLLLGGRIEAFECAGRKCAFDDEAVHDGFTADAGGGAGTSAANALPSNRAGNNVMSVFILLSQNFRKTFNRQLSRPVLI
jgi:hypothetical protein